MSYHFLNPEEHGCCDAVFWQEFRRGPSGGVDTDRVVTLGGCMPSDGQRRGFDEWVGKQKQKRQEERPRGGGRRHCHARWCLLSFEA